MDAMTGERMTIQELAHCYFKHWQAGTRAGLQCVEVSPGWYAVDSRSESEPRRVRVDKDDAVCSCPAAWKGNDCAHAALALAESSLPLWREFDQRESEEWAVYRMKIRTGAVNPRRRKLVKLEMEEIEARLKESVEVAAETIPF